MSKAPNLDALIRREDFDINESVVPTSANVTSVGISDLRRDAFFYNALRKPDFQRETCDWSPDKICEFIRTFLDGDLVPAIILWQSPGGTFVIDGAHRLSALIAWINDDYGDGIVSADFFDSQIIDEQKAIASRTRKLIAQHVGTFADYQALARSQDPTKPERSRRALLLGQVAIQLQWVKGSSQKAEDSFYRINLSATPIDETELSMIKARRKPNALASRAIIRAGSGHKYWLGFPQEVQVEVEEHARVIYDLLCNPPLSMPIKTLDIPAAGVGYSPDTVRLVFDLVNYLFGLKPEMWIAPPRKASGTTTASLWAAKLGDDEDGAETVKYLRSVRRIASRMIGEHSGSLGLHPAVYFYGATGKFQPVAFLAMVALVRDLEDRDKFDEFTKVRKDFEEFLIRHRSFVNLIGRNVGAGIKGLGHALTMYQQVLEGIASQQSDDQIVKSIRSDPRLAFIADPTEEDRKYGKNFSIETKSAVFMGNALSKAEICGICGGRLHVRSISYDHIIRIQDGGTGVPENSQLTHPYCNSGYKERQNSTGKRSGPIKFGFSKTQAA